MISFFQYHFMNSQCVQMHARASILIKAIYPLRTQRERRLGLGGLVWPCRSNFTDIACLQITMSTNPYVG